MAGTATVSGEKSTDTNTEVNTKSSNGSGSVGGLRNFLFRQPHKIFNSLMQTSVRVVQRGMDAFQGVSNKVYHVARKQIGAQRTGGSSSASASKSDEGGGTTRTPAKRQAVAVKKPTGFIKRVAKMLDTGIAGIEQVTDLGLLLGNMGTHKIMSNLNGESGNQEIYKMLIKYIGTYTYRYNARNGVGAHIIINLKYDIFIIMIYIYIYYDIFMGKHFFVVPL